MAESNQKKTGSRGGKARADARKDALRAERRAAREAVMGLLFETEYHEGEAPETIYLRAAEAREVSTEDRYIRRTYLGIMQNLEAIDDLIGRHATGWRTGRLSRVSRAVLRLGVYELAFDEKIPAAVAINEAVELAKKFDDPRARAFVNGVLNAVKTELAERRNAATAETPETESVVTEAPETDEAL